MALKLQPALLDEARKVAAAEGVGLDQLVNAALAEKLSAMRTGQYFEARAARGSVAAAREILGRAGAGNPPLAGDELPE